MQTKNIIIALFSIIIMILVLVIACQLSCNKVTKTNNNNIAVAKKSVKKSASQKDSIPEITKTENYGSTKFLGINDKNNLIIRSEMGHVKEIALDDNIQYKNNEIVITLEEFKNRLSQSQEINKDANVQPEVLRLNVVFKTSTVTKEDKIEVGQIESISIISN